MRTLIKGLISAIVVMVLLPYLAVTLARADAGMAICLILFFAVNPVYSLFLGMFSGKNLRTLWCLPLVSSLLFIAGTWMFFDFKEILFIYYAAIYLVISAVSMLISHKFSKK